MSRYYGTASSDPILWFKFGLNNNSISEKFKTWVGYTDPTHLDLIHLSISDIWVIFHEYKDDL